METTTIAQRFRELIDHYGLTKTALSKKLGMPSNSTVVRIANDYNKGMSYEILYKIGTSFPEVDMNWLVMGEGEMIKVKELNTEMYNIKYMDTDGKMKDVLHVAGYKDCDKAFSDINGNSMAPAFVPGDTILCQLTTWDRVVLGDPYRIVGKTGIIIRYVIAVNDGKMVLHAENPRYPDYEILVDDIIELYSIKGYIRRVSN